MKKVEFGNSLDPAEVAHYEPPHLDLLCLPCCLQILIMVKLGGDMFYLFIFFFFRHKDNNRQLKKYTLSRFTSPWQCFSNTFDVKFEIAISLRQN